MELLRFDHISKYLKAGRKAWEIDASLRAMGMFVHLILLCTRIKNKDCKTNRTVETRFQWAILPPVFSFRCRMKYKPVYTNWLYDSFPYSM